MNPREHANPVRSRHGFAAAGLVFLAVALLYAGGALRVLDNKLLDARFALFSRPANHDLVVVAIDPESLARFGTWPWPRDYHATVIGNLMKAGAKRVAFDVDFSSASNPAADRRLAEAVAAAHGRVTLAALKQRRQEAAQGTILTEPLPALRAAADLASVSVRPDEDGVVRRIRVREPWRGGFLPSIPARLAGAADAPESFYIDFGFEPGTIPQISYADVLADSFDPKAVAGKLVIVGATAVQLGDYLPVPRFGVLPGVDVLGLAFQSLVHGRALQHLDAGWILAGVLLICLVMGPLCARLSWRLGLAALAAAGGAILAALLAAFAMGTIIDAAPLLLAAFLCFVGGTLSRSDWQALVVRLQKREIRHKDTMMNGVVHNSFDAIFIMDDTGRIEETNKAAADMFGGGDAALRGRDITQLIPSARNLIPRASMHLVPTPDATRSEMTARRFDGSAFPVEIAMREMTTETGCWQIAFVRDITERKAHQQELEHQALHDALTGLPNRTQLYRTLKESIRHAAHTRESFALLLLDLDRFKEINDTLGHHIGDALLRQIAQRLRRPLRRTDMIARLGGDEFAVLLSPAPDRASVISIAERLQHAFDTPLRCNGMALDLGASIGVAFFPDDSADATELVQKADVAMYQAKHAAQPIAFYDPATDRNSVRHLTLTGELKRAIEDGGLMLYYQPKISVETGEVIGVESLVRWKHATHGFVPPDEFVLLAERTGLIRKLTEWVLETAFAQSARWRAAGRPLDVAVNLSARNLQDSDLPGLVEMLLARHEVAPGSVVLEITESAIMADPERARAVIGLLHARGLRLSIDDFGTGYSSLGYLKKLPVHELKIDRSFVQDMMENDNDRVIVKSTVDLAHNLGLSVVAEGVENAEALEALKTLGADVAQGYFMSRPLAAADFETWLSGWQRGLAKPALRLVAGA